VQLLESTRCEIVLTDMQMPEMDGLTLCRQVRAKYDASYVYIMMLTVRGKQLDVLAGLAAGVDDYVIKGASWEEILARIAVGRRITQRAQPIPDGGTDPVSGASNRRYVMEHLSRELESARLFDQPLALLICALDGLREIGERLGSSTGAGVLRSFVSGVLANIREQSDWIARIDIDRFLVVLPQTNIGGARRAADRMRGLLREQPPLTGTGPVALTMSVGVTALESSYEITTVPVLEFLRAADRCLRVSQRLGGDCVTAEPALQIRALSAELRTRSRNDIN
jgi:two-component system cell cycle response regulator